MTTPTCATCRFFREVTAGGGWCRRFPPTIVRGIPERFGGVHEPDFPFVVNINWCGEFIEDDGTQRMHQGFKKQKPRRKA